MFFGRWRPVAIGRSQGRLPIAGFSDPARRRQRGRPFNFVAIEPAAITRYQITELRATRASDILVVRYLADVEGTVNRDPYAPGPAPRLSVFVWSGSDWQLAAHANFNPLDG